jgi:hypothetical protein
MKVLTRHFSNSRFATFALVFGSLSYSGVAAARSTIREPGAHPSYLVELEPHLTYGPYDPPGEHRGEGLGLGFRATIPVLQNGFISKINNSVGISFGVDWMHYWGNERDIGYCSRWATGPGNTRICTRVGEEVGGDSTYLLFPVAMQWNFWLADKFSAFGEPGLSLYWEKGEFQDNWRMGATPLLQVGGRWHFLPNTTLTFRLGYPNITLGLSMLL